MRLTHTRLFAAILFILAYSHCAWATDATLTGTIRDPFGNAFNGQIVMTLSQPAVDPTGVVDYVPLQVPFTVLNGALPAAAKVVSNDSLQPNNTYYLAQYFDPTGVMTVQKVFYFLAGPNNLGSMIPTNITTNNVSYLSPVSLSANNAFTGSNTFSQKINSTVTTGTAPLGVASTTPVANLGASHIVSDTANPATTGVVELANADRICWRNAGNVNNICLSLSAAGQPQYQDIGFGTTNVFTTTFRQVGSDESATTINTNLSEVAIASPLAVLAAGDAKVAVWYDIHADGILTNTSGGASNYTVRVRFDSAAGTVMCASAVVSVATGVSNAPWQLDCKIGVATTGGAGTVTASGIYTINATTGAIANATAITLDTTISHGVYVTEQMSVSNVNTSFTKRIVTMTRIGN